MVGNRVLVILWKIEKYRILYVRQYFLEQQPGHTNASGVGDELKEVCNVTHLFKLQLHDTHLYLTHTHSEHTAAEILYRFMF